MTTHREDEREEQGGEEDEEQEQSELDEEDQEQQQDDDNDDSEEDGEEESGDVDEEEDSSWEAIAEDPELVSRVLESIGGLVPGLLKRVAVSGVGNLLMNEDGLRAMLSENKKLPKEAVGLLVGQADVMRREVLRIISREIRIFLENMDLGGEVAKILTSVSFEVKTEVRFIPNDQAVGSKKDRARRRASKQEQERSVGGGEPGGVEAEEEEEREESDLASAAGHIARKLRWKRRRREPASESEEGEE